MMWQFNYLSMLIKSLALLAMLFAVTAHAQFVVMDVRGAPFKSGQSIAATAVINLKEGERLSAIGPDGKTVTLRGPFSGPLAPKADAVPDSKQALAALLVNRDARTKSVGVVRAGTASVKTPQPELIDITRGGPRCLTEGDKPLLWRPNNSTEQKFVIYPGDRSWRADFVWESGQDRMQMPDLSKFDGMTTLLVNIDQQEFVITLTTVPTSITNDFIRAAWMLEKGCVQQADALLKSLSENASISSTNPR
jgi:hypothetical protein